MDKFSLMVSVSMLHIDFFIEKYEKSIDMIFYFTFSLFFC